MGLRGGQVAVLGGGLLTAFGILLLTQQPVLVVAAGVAALAVAFVPLGARTLEQWAPVALRYAARRALGRHHWTSPAPLRGRPPPSRAPGNRRRGAGRAAALASRAGHPHGDRPRPAAGRTAGGHRHHPRPRRRDLGGGAAGAGLHLRAPRRRRAA